MTNIQHKQAPYTQPLQQPNRYAIAAPAGYHSSQYAQTLQQLQRQQAQVQSQVVQSQNQYSSPDQYNAAYYAYQQQQQALVQQHLQQKQEQQRYAQQQQQLLKQLYSQQQLQQPIADVSQQPQANEYYTAEQYADYLSRQQAHILNTQQQQVQQQYRQGSYNTAAADPTTPAVNAHSYTAAASHLRSAAIPPRNGLETCRCSASDKVSMHQFVS